VWVRLSTRLLKGGGGSPVRLSKHRRKANRDLCDAKQLVEKGLLVCDVLPACRAGVSSGLVCEAVGFRIAEPVVADPKLSSYGPGHVGIDFYRGELYSLGGIKEMSCILVAVA
jgi:hypothetical protein